MIVHPIVIEGIPLPSDAPAFLALVAVHVLAGLGASVSGMWAMLATKAPGSHPRAGSVYYWSLALVTLTMAALAALRWAEDQALFALGVLSMAAASLARSAIRRRWRRYRSIHIVGMGSSYVILLTAFYVDNGRSLPIWRELPTLVYWLLPSVIGGPLMVRAVRKYAPRGG